MVINFDLSPIPSNVDIIKAELSLFMFMGDSLEFPGRDISSLFTIARSWNESEVTWKDADKNTQWEDLDLDTKFYNTIEQDTVSHPGGVDFNPEPVATAPWGDADTWENYDVTNVLSKILKNGEPFYGFMVKMRLSPYDEHIIYLGRNYFSSEYEEIDKRPKLTIEYEGTGIHENSGVNKFIGKIVTQKSAKTLKILIPFECNYTVSIIDIRGRQVLLFEGNGENWFSIPEKSFSQGIHIMRVRTPEITVVKKLWFIR